MAQRAGYICSHPLCQQLTIGPSEDRGTKLTNVGEAAHITAASPGGPRYDVKLTKTERQAEANGIWLCRVHAKQVDDNASKETVDELRRWKVSHEDWVYRRVAAADSLVQHGITDLAIENIGPFRSRAAVKFGRHNIVFGLNNSGKSTFCECLAALSGGRNLAALEKRWGLFKSASQAGVIEAAASIKGARTSVRLSEELVELKRLPQRRPQRLQVEVDGNVSASWPQTLFNVVYVDNQAYRPSDLKDPFRRDLRALAPQLALSEAQLWDALREPLFCSTTFGSRVRRTGAYSVEVQVAGSSHFLPTENLGGAEYTFTILDIALRVMRSDPRPVPWMLVIDSSMFLRLDADNQRRVLDGVQALDEPPIQTLVCLNSEQEAVELSSATTERWVGSSTAGRLTLHAFR
ncbi:ATP-binding protein [Sphingomonas sp. BK481]|nr:ATP-binding protein [Sphingomonas sp. BK481]